MFFPIMIDIKEKKIVIIGGGKIGYRKAKTLLEFGGQVLVISIDFIEEFYRLKNQYGENLSFIKDNYKKEYIKDAFMIIGATSSREINNQISIDAKNMDILSNIVDSQKDSSFISQSIINRKGLIMSVSTMGKFPYLSKKIKEDIKKDYSKYDSEYMDLLENLRKIVLLDYRDEKREIFDKALKLDKDGLRNFTDKLINKDT